MSPIRVAIGEVQSAILKDILVQITDLQPDMEFVGPVDEASLKEAIAEQRTEVLIWEITPSELPQVCRELFSGENPPVVVGLARGGREATICIANAGVAQLTSVIRSALPRSGDSARVFDFFPRAESDAKSEVIKPYLSTTECIEDQLRCLDLALLADVEAFESTIWDENVQRLQGLAISPDEVRSLLMHRTRSIAPERQGEDLRRRGDKLANETQQRIVASLGRPDAPPFVRLIERFALEAFDQFCISSALALELDRNTYGKAYAFLQDDATRRNPSLELLIRLFEGKRGTEGWESARAFDTSRPLRHWNLLRFAQREEGEPSTPFGRRIEIDDRIARFLLGLDDLGPQLEQVASTRMWEADVLRITPPHEATERLSSLISNVRQGSPGSPSNLVVQIHGRSGTGKRRLIASICETHGLRLLRIDVGKLVVLPSPQFEEMLTLLARESILQPVALCLENVDSLVVEEVTSSHNLKAITDALQFPSSLTFLISERRWSPGGVFRDGIFQQIGFDLPVRSVAREIWLRELADEQLDPKLDSESVAEELAATFSLSPGQIHDAVGAARVEAFWRCGQAQLTLPDLSRGCRQQFGHGLSKLATHFSSELKWDHLVLPEKQLTQLHDLLTAIRNSNGVLQEWDFACRLPYGRGITALFSGPSGTGKTMAAGILARELGLDLYKIDLSRVVSKYIGETEKNLDRIFQEAEDANAMLFFDEADALFGKRSTIRDAHDRYANIEIAYLLQKMEERLGVTILASNLKTNMDEAFMRRIRHGVEFPMPEYEQRLKIWRGSLPEKVPLADNVDLTWLAKRLRISGGSIMNIAVGAASLAYKPGGEIAMQHFLRAAKRELEKLGQQYDEGDFAETPVVANAA